MLSSFLLSSLLVTINLATGFAFTSLTNRPHFLSIRKAHTPSMATDDAALRKALDQLGVTISNELLVNAEATVARQADELAQYNRYFVSRSMQPSKGTLRDLCDVSKQACDILAPMIKTFYAKCSESFGTAKLKSDATFFSIADGIVQHLLVEHLFAGNKFGNIVGEEDETSVNIIRKPFTVDDLIVPSEFDDLVERTRDDIRRLAERIDDKSYKGITVFVDPIDGTREFATGKGEFCSILIGFNNLIGKPVAGIMYRPLTARPTWAIGAKSENYCASELDMAKVPKPTGVLVSDGVNTPFLEKVIEELQYEKVPCYASGNRALMLLEGKGGAYIRDTGGFAKWDCSGPQAVLEAFGGTMSKLPRFISEKVLDSYTYLETKENLDFIPDTTLFTLSNAKDKRVARMVRNVLISEVDLVKEYSCLCGLIALDKTNLQELDKFHAAMVKVQAQSPPMYT